MLVAAQHGLIGSNMSAPVDVSYLADTVILFRYFEAEGAIRQALSVVKKRRSLHERTPFASCALDQGSCVRPALARISGRAIWTAGSIAVRIHACSDRDDNHERA